MSGQTSALMPALRDATTAAFGSRTPGTLATPWLDYASLAVPDNHELILWWAQYLWLSDGTFRTAMERVAAHFMTTIEFPDLDPDEENAWKDFFNQHFNYRSELPACASDYLTYGNLIILAYLPFRRFLICEKCGMEKPIEEITYEVAFTNEAPYVTWKRKQYCPKCEDGGPYKCVDRRDTDLSRLRLIRFDPREIEIAQNRYSGRKDIYWKIPDEDRRDILSRADIHVNDTPLEILQAVAVNGKLKLDPQFCLHMCENVISGVRTRGWGIPRSISNFRTAWMQQLTNKADQAIAIDYTLGMRFISPAPTNGGAFDPMQTHGMEEFVSRMQGIVAQQRNNPASIFTVPYPINYQFAGGEGGTLIPPDKLKFRQQEYLSQLGIPLEYQQMNMQTQAAPMALRLFEAYWQGIPALYNKLLSWIVELISNTYGFDRTKVEMQKTTIADDMERKQALLQLMAANQLSPQTALKPFGIDANIEVDKVLKHQSYVTRRQAELAEEDQDAQELGALRGLTAQPSPTMLAQQAMQQQQGGGAPPPGAPMGGMPTGGMPGAGGGQPPQTLSQMSDQAAQIAQQLAGMPEYDRKQQLKSLREGNKDLHALVKQQLDQIRSQARSQGGQMMLQQQAQGGGAPPPM